MANKSYKHLYFIFGVLLIAANMRPAITAVGPIIDEMQRQLTLSSSLIGFLTTLPILCFGLISPVVPRFSKQLGMERLLLIGLLLLIIGILIRSLFAILGLFLGTIFIGLAIAIFNVVLPSLIKQKFAHQVGFMTGLYTSVMGVWASLGSGLSYPLAKSLPFGWRGAIGCWALLAIFAFIIWLPYVRSQQWFQDKIQMRSSQTKLWKSRLAWYVTIFMGLQSIGFYSCINWLPTILVDKGMSVTSAGWMLSLMQLIGLPATFIIPVIADRLRDQKGITLGISLLALLGYMGLFFDHHWLIYFSIICIGIGQGATLSLAMAFIALRASNTEQSAVLSGMAQSIGYLIAAVGPILFGLIYDLTHSWTPSLVILVFLTLLMALFGYYSGRDEYV